MRLAGDSWIDHASDLETARKLAALDCSLPELIREVYSMRPGWDEARIAQRTREVLEAPSRLKEDVRTWLRPVAEGKGPLLDLGCGAGMLIAALAAGGRPAIGIDVSMTWLVVAKRLITASGGTPALAAAMGEALPIRNGRLAGVISLDVIEHVRNPDTYLAEISRTVRTGGQVALSTPNRFSLTAEPHVFVWGVGWLPTRWQAAYVRWRSGKTYDDTTLMSSFGLLNRIRLNTAFAFQILIPKVPVTNLERFTPFKAALARLYNRLAIYRPMRAIFLLIGPFFRVIAVKENPVDDNS